MGDTFTPVAGSSRRERAVVWMDRDRALVAKSRAGRHELSEVVRDVRPDAEFLPRVANEAAGCERILVMGPDDIRLAFELQYVAIYRRPDRLLDGAAEIAPEPRRLVELLRRLERPVA